MTPTYLVGCLHALRTTEIEELPHPVALPPAACFAAFRGMQVQPVF
jgi:hypothetical protein